MPEPAFSTPAQQTAAGVPAVHGRSPSVPEPAVRRVAGVVGDPALRDVATRYFRGEVSAPVALMQMVCASESAAAVREAVDAATEEVWREVRATDGILLDRADALTRAVVEHGEGLERIAAMLRDGTDTSEPMPSVDAGLAHVERLFDWSVRRNEEASVALYSLGSPELLAEATDEVVALLERWGGIGPTRDVLDVGCGIGRMERALTARVREVWGVDVSGAMVDAARRRCAGLANVHVEKTDGRDLRRFPDARFDLVLAVDSFPYLVQSGEPLVAAHLAEARRVLRPGGALVILNYSYRGDLAADRADVQRLAAVHGLAVEVDGEQPFTLWDGSAWRLRRVPDA